VIPEEWKKYVIKKLLIIDFVVDFSMRIKQLNKFINEEEYQRKGVWLGGIMFPEAFMTATR